jgi:hypothetical protein
LREGVVLGRSVALAATTEPNNERKGKTNNTSANSSSQHRADHPHEVDAASFGGRQAVVTVVGAPRSPDITDRRPPDRSVSRDGSVGSPSHGP